MPFNFVWGPGAGIIGFLEYTDAYTRSYFAKHADFHPVCKISNVCYEIWGAFVLLFVSLGVFLLDVLRQLQTYHPDLLCQKWQFSILVRFVMLLGVAQQVLARGKNCQKGFVKFPRYVAKIG